jgi:hypothetical protein
MQPVFDIGERMHDADQITHMPPVVSDQAAGSPAVLHQPGFDLLQELPDLDLLGFIFLRRPVLDMLDGLTNHNSSFLGMPQ